MLTAAQRFCRPARSLTELVTLLQARAAAPAAAAADPQSLVRQEGQTRLAGQALHGSGSDSGRVVCCSGFCGSGQHRGAHAREDEQGGFREVASEALPRRDWAVQVQVQSPLLFPALNMLLSDM